MNMVHVAPFTQKFAWHLPLGDLGPIYYHPTGHLDRVSHFSRIHSRYQRTDSLREWWESSTCKTRPLVLYIRRSLIITMTTRSCARHLSVEILQLQNISLENPVEWHYLRDSTFSRFDTIPECDRHTHTHRVHADGQTHDDGIYRTWHSVAR